MKSMSISKKVVYGLVAAVILSSVLIAAPQAFLIYDMSNKNAQDAADSVVNEQLYGIMNTTSNLGNFIHEKMDFYFDGVYMMEEYAENLFNVRYNATPQHSYFWDPDLEFQRTGYRVPNIQSIPEYESDSISFDVSCYYMPRPYYNGGDPFNWDSDMKYVLDTTSNMDNVFRSLHQMSPDYIWLYMGFDTGITDNHLFKNYPYDNLDYFLGYYNDNHNDPTADYDPNKEAWYANAVAATDGKVAITAPYGDPSTGLVLSMGRPIRFDNGTLIGVVSADVTLDTINQNVVSLKVLDNGYAFLLDHDGSLLAHPKWTIEGQTLYDLEFGGSQTADAVAFQSTLTQILNSDKGQQKFTKNGETWYITYEKIADTGMIVCTVTPYSDVIAPAIALTNAVNAQVFQQFGLLVIFMLGIIAASAKISSRQGRAVAEPVIEMTKVLKDISTGNVRDLIDTSSIRFEEVRVTADAILYLQHMGRIANEDFIRGNLAAANESYSTLLNLATDMEIVQGIQAMEMNLGNVHRQRGQIEEARRRYERAEKLAKEMLDKAKNEEERVDALERLAQIQHNYAILSMDEDDFYKAMEFLNESIKYDEEIGNTKGLSRHYDAMGMCYMALGETDRARAEFEKALDIAIKVSNRRTISYIEYHMGRLLADMGQHAEAERRFRKSAEIAAEMGEIGLAITVLEALADSLDAMNKSSHEVRVQIEELKTRGGRGMLYLFLVIDSSGSMEGARIEAAVAGAQNILNNVIGERDQLGVIKFQSSPRVVRDMSPVTDKNKASREIRKALSTGGATAFFDAVGLAAKKLMAITEPGQRWIVALTDGMDNQSSKYGTKKLKSEWNSRKTEIEKVLRESPVPIKLVIIGVRCEKKYDKILQAICDDIPDAEFLPVDRGGDVRLAIQRQFEQVEQKLMAQLEIGGTQVDY
ncbi:MAG: cache domain-containing protein [Candidatus Thorarchaeota archaeon]